MADDWTLTPAQFYWMKAHHVIIENAYANDDMAALTAMSETDTYAYAFGDMSWDEAYDRYEDAIEGEPT